MRKFPVLFFFFSYAIAVNAQITGTKIITIDFATLASALNALNTQGVGAGGVIINIPAGYTEQAPPGGYNLGSATLNASLSASNPLILQKDPSSSGANPILTAFTGTTPTNDGMFFISGADYVTINAIDLQESASNTTPRHQMEWGYAIVKLNASDGSQNITISNCTITLNKSNSSTVGIYGGNNIASSTSLLTITNTSGINSNIKINGCTITNCYIPISVFGYLGSSTYYDTGLEIGSSVGNMISDFGGSAGSAFGVSVTGQNSVKIENNTITLNPGSTVNVSG